MEGGGRRGAEGCGDSTPSVLVYMGGEEELSSTVATSSSAIQLYQYVTMRRTSVSMQAEKQA